MRYQFERLVAKVRRLRFRFLAMFAERSAAQNQFEKDGVFVIPQFLDDLQTAELKRFVDEVYNFLATAEDHELSTEAADNYRRWYGVRLDDLPYRFRAPELNSRYKTIIDSVTKRTQTLFGKNWGYFPQRSYFRRHVGSTKLVPWHIDADAAAIGSSPCLNVWLPMARVGVDLSSLELVPQSHKLMLQYPLLDGSDRYRDDSFVHETGLKPIIPALKPGDAIVFDSFVLHRTQRIETDKLRDACEFRFVARW